MSRLERIETEHSRHKPSIAFLGYTGDETASYDVKSFSALKAIASKDMGYSVLEIIDPNAERSKKILKGQIQRRLLAAIVIYHEFSLSTVDALVSAIEDLESPTKSAGFVDEVQKLRKIKAMFNPNIPVFVHAGFARSFIDDEDCKLEPNLSLVDIKSPVFLDQLQELADSKRLALRKHSNAIFPEVEALLASHKANYPDDESVVGGMDDNHRIVAQALRTRLLPGELLIEVFDKHIPKKEPPKKPEKGTYLLEIDKIRSMSDKDRKRLFIELLSNQGNLESKGSYCSGFAIDLISLESQVTTGFAQHDLAKYYLNERLGIINKMRKIAKQSIMSDDVDRFIIQGLITRGIKGFKTPFLEFNSMTLEVLSSEEIRKLAKHMIEEERFIPISTENKKLKILDDV